MCDAAQYHIEDKAAREVLTEIWANWGTVLGIFLLPLRVMRGYAESNYDRVGKTKNSWRTMVKKTVPHRSPLLVSVRVVDAPVWSCR